MTEEISSKKNLTILIINLVLLGLCAAGLVLMLLVYQIYRKNNSPSAAMISATLRVSATASLSPTATVTPSITVTPRPTSSPTITPSPSWSPTASGTPTLTLFPSLTPALAVAYKGAYKLADWNEEEADRMAQIVQGYPAGIFAEPTQPFSLDYLQAYAYPIFALKEALLRFPDASQAEKWRWALAYNLALTGDDEAGQVYAEIIADALNRGQVSISELYAWLPIQEPRLNLFMTAVPTSPGYHSRYLVELRGMGGSAFILLLDKTPAFQAFPLLTAFNFAEPRSADWILGDLDNKSSNGEEVAIYLSTLSGEINLQPPYVYNLSAVEPIPLKFQPVMDILPIGMEFDNRWLLQVSSTGDNELVFRTVIFPACPLQIERSFHWNGLYFEPGELKVEFAGEPADLAQCELLVEHARHHWDPQQAVSIMETLLPKWPPSKDAQGNPFPADELDRLRYRLAVSKALSGDFDGAIEMFNKILAEPSVPTSSWIGHAQNFLADYQTPDDIYRACRTSPECDPSAAIQMLASRVPSQQDPIRFLREWGVEPISSGFFDFEDDDESERWFTVRSIPQQRLDFWTLFKSTGMHSPILIGSINSRVPTIEFIEAAYIAEEGLHLQPAVLLDGQLSFNIQRVPDTRQPYVLPVPLRKEYPSRFFVPLGIYKDALLQGSSPELVQDNLKKLAIFPGLLCKSTWTCDEYYYLLGLAGELSQDEDSAVEAYQFLWLNYSKSPFTTMARLKLVALATVVPPTFTPTITGTSTPPVATATPSPSVTTTPATSTPVQTPTATVSGTPPTATNTPPPTSPPVVPTPTNSGSYPYPTFVSPY